MSAKPPDFELWAEVVKSVRPLNHLRQRKHSASGSALAAPVKCHPGPSSPTIHVLRPCPAHPPPISGLDRRTAQRMTRGNVELERRIDLHGIGVEMARVRLLEFLQVCQADGVRTALVITGKGDSPYSRHTLHGTGHFHSPERKGRLRRALSDWFQEPGFRAAISGFQPAHPKHGGGGAFYVRIRRLRSQP